MENLPSVPNGMLSKSGNPITKAYYQGSIIKDCPPETIALALKYSFNLIGLPESQFPSNEQKFALIEVIKKHFPTARVEEIKEAYEHYSAGKLNIDAELYGKTFNFASLSKILNNYIESKRNVLIAEINKNSNKVPEIPEEEAQENLKRFSLINIDTILIPSLVEFETTGQINYNSIASTVSYLYKLCKPILPDDKAYKKQLYEKVKKQRYEMWKETIKRKTTEKTEEAAIKGLENFIKGNIMEYEGVDTTCFKAGVYNQCKDIILKETIKKLGKDNFIKQLKQHYEN